MTEYGESITQKEILTDSYIVIPGFIENAENLNALDTLNADWKLVSPNNYELTFKEFFFSHFIVNDIDLKEIKLSSKNDFVLMQFCLSGNISFNDNDKQTISFKAGEHNILFIPDNLDLVTACDSNNLDLVNIYFEKNFILKYIPVNHLLSNMFNGKSFGRMSSNNLSISPKIQSVLSDIINCGFDGHLKKLFTQAKLIELLTLQLAQYEEENNSTVVLKQSEIDKMMIVKDIITSDVKESFSLSYLARAAGTNEQYLKKNFKILFSSTVFNYILSFKMEKAKELLMQGDHKISDVAELTGYKHATHFTSAFKKFFGYLPQKIKGKLDVNLIGLSLIHALEIL